MNDLRLLPVFLGRRERLQDELDDCRILVSAIITARPLVSIQSTVVASALLFGHLLSTTATWGAGSAAASQSSVV